jgi:hypothetical protein
MSNFKHKEKKMKTKIILVFVVILLVTISVFADMKGKDVAEKGQVSDVSGVLSTENNEWYLNSSDKKMIIHLGPEFYRDEIGLKLEENKKIEINGFVYQDEVTPITIKFDGKEYMFRDQYGRPGWAGRGNRDGNYRQNESHDRKENPSRNGFKNDRRGDRKGLQG